MKRRNKSILKPHPYTTSKATFEVWLTKAHEGVVRHMNYHCRANSKYFQSADAKKEQKIDLQSFLKVISVLV